MQTESGIYDYGPGDGTASWNPESGFKRLLNGFAPSYDIRCLDGSCDINRAQENDGEKLRVYINDLKNYMKYDSQNTGFE